MNFSELTEHHELSDTWVRISYYPRVLELKVQDVGISKVALLLGLWEIICSVPLLELLVVCLQYWAFLELQDITWVLPSSSYGNLPMRVYFFAFWWGHQLWKFRIASYSNFLLPNCICNEPTLEKGYFLMH